MNTCHTDASPNVRTSLGVLRPRYGAENDFQRREIIFSAVAASDYVLQHVRVQLNISVRFVHARACSALVHMKKSMNKKRFFDVNDGAFGVNQLLLALISLIRPHLANSISSR